MLKRTKGRLLISLLVVTGLAGTLNSGSISQKERKQGVQLLKNTRNEMANSIAELSEQQLNYRPGKSSASIKDLLYKIAATEISFSSEMKKIMDQSSESEKRLLLSFEDAQIMEMPGVTPRMPESISFANANEALQQFISVRNDNIRYLRTSTEDLRHHVIKTEIGWVDGYQKFLLHGKANENLIAQIKAIKASPHFPKK